MQENNYAFQRLIWLIMTGTVAKISYHLSLGADHSHGSTDSLRTLEQQQTDPTGVSS